MDGHQCCYAPENRVGGWLYRWQGMVLLDVSRCLHVIRWGGQVCAGPGGLEPGSPSGLHLTRQISVVLTATASSSPTETSAGRARPWPRAPRPSGSHAGSLLELEELPRRRRPPRPGLRRRTRTSDRSLVTSHAADGPTDPDEVRGRQANLENPGRGDGSPVASGPVVLPDHDQNESGFSGWEADRLRRVRFSQHARVSCSSAWIPAGPPCTRAATVRM